jgi:hypothetical protein
MDRDRLVKLIAQDLRRRAAEFERGERKLSQGAQQILRYVRLFDLGLIKPTPAQEALANRILARMDREADATKAADQRLAEIARAAGADVRARRR